MDLFKGSSQFPSRHTRGQKGAQAKVRKGWGTHEVYCQINILLKVPTQLRHFVVTNVKNCQWVASNTIRRKLLGKG